MACELAEVMETGGATGGEYTLLFTDEDGATQEVSLTEDVLLLFPDSDSTLRDLAHFAFIDGYLCPVQFRD